MRSRQISGQGPFQSQTRIEKKDKDKVRKPAAKPAETRVVPLTVKPANTVSLYKEEGNKTVFKAGQQTVEVNVRIKKTPTTPEPSSAKAVLVGSSNNKALRRGSWGDILSHSMMDGQPFHDRRSPRGNHMITQTDLDQNDNRKNPLDRSPQELAAERKAEADQLRAQLIRREERRIAEAERYRTQVEIEAQRKAEEERHRAQTERANQQTAQIEQYRQQLARDEIQRSAEVERVRAQLSRLQMENDVMRKELKAALEVGRHNDELAKDYANTINELYQLCTHLKDEVAQLKKAQKSEERQGSTGRDFGAGDTHASNPVLPSSSTVSTITTPSQLVHFQSGLRDVRTKIETEMAELDRRISTPLPLNSVERELTEAETDARRILTRKLHDTVDSSSERSFEGFDHSSTQYLNLPARPRSPAWDRL